jgi:hypothetical protein
MNEAEQALENKARALVGEMTRQEGIKVMEVLLERSSEAEIVDALRMAKLDRELEGIARGL